jgi:hypothetical protein
MVRSSFCCSFLLVRVRELCFNCLPVFAQMLHFATLRAKAELLLYFIRKLFALARTAQRFWCVRFAMV